MAKGVVERVTTGVKGLDDKIEGGFVRGSANLITGKTGTGKTGFCASFIYEGAMKGEVGFYITTEEMVQDIKDDIIAMFGWDFDDLEKKGLIKFLPIKPDFPLRSLGGDDINKLIKMYITDLYDKIITGIKGSGAKRAVIDSVSLIEMFIKDKFLSRTVLIQLVENLKKMGVTAIMVETVHENSEALSGGGIIEYLVDSVIKLDFVPVSEDYKRTLNVRKMRRTDHSTMIHPFDIKKGGMEVIDIEKISLRRK